MIRYRPAPALGIAPETAAACGHPAIADLGRYGPWSAAREPGGTILTMVVPGWKAAGWGPWLPGVDREYAMALNQPPLALLRRKRLAKLETAAVELACGETILIAPAISDGVAYGLTLAEPTRPASPYSRRFFELIDRREGAPPSTDDWLACIRLAIQAGHRLPDDAIRERCLVADADAEGYLEAMATGPKAGPASAG